MAETTALSPILHRAPLVDRQTLMVTRPWSQWLEALYIRTGGVSAPANGTLAADLATLTAAVVALTARVEDAEAAIGALATRVTVAEAAIVALDTRLDTAESDLVALDGRLNTAEATLTTHGTRLTALEATDVALDSRLDTLEAKHTALAAVSALTDSSGGSADNTVANVPNPADAPATPDALRDDLVANVLPVVRNDLADLTAKLNAVRAALV